MVFIQFHNCGEIETTHCGIFSEDVRINPKTIYIIFWFLFYMIFKAYIENQNEVYLKIL